MKGTIHENVQDQIVLILTEGRKEKVAEKVADIGEEVEVIATLLMTRTILGRMIGLMKKLLNHNSDPYTKHKWSK